MRGRRGNSNTTTADTVVGNNVVNFLCLRILSTSFDFSNIVNTFTVAGSIVIVVLNLTVNTVFIHSVAVFLISGNALSRFICLRRNTRCTVNTLTVVVLLSIGFRIPRVVANLVNVTFVN